MYAGDDEISTTTECTLVEIWCAPFYIDARPRDQQMGDLEIPAEAVKKANKTIPVDPIEAQGTKYWPTEFKRKATKEDYKSAREFLSQAAEHDLDIWGSY